MLLSFGSVLGVGLVISWWFLVLYTAQSIRARGYRLPELLGSRADRFHLLFRLRQVLGTWPSTKNSPDKMKAKKMQSAANDRVTIQALAYHDIIGQISHTAMFANATTALCGIVNTASETVLRSKTASFLTHLLSRSGSSQNILTAVDVLCSCGRSSGA
jgi:hypothetical protein